MLSILRPQGPLTFLGVRYLKQIKLFPWTILECFCFYLFHELKGSPIRNQWGSTYQVLNIHTLCTRFLLLTLTLSDFYHTSSLSLWMINITYSPEGNYLVHIGIPKLCVGKNIPDDKVSFEMMDNYQIKWIGNFWIWSYNIFVLTPQCK